MAQYNDEQYRRKINPIPPPVFGCMDPFAINYNPSATQDNGSCIYEPGLPPKFL
jgi:hypothetical protein